MNATLVEFCKRNNVSPVILEYVAKRTECEECVTLEYINVNTNERLTEKEFIAKMREVNEWKPGFLLMNASGFSGEE